MLIGSVLQNHLHAKIIAIRTEKAKQAPGVSAVLTHEDIPGMNAYGIAAQDQPVFCFDVVRYIGDVAAVAAKYLVERALALIEVDYEVLPIIMILRSLENAPQLHPHGNVLHRNGYSRGDGRHVGLLYIVEEMSTQRRFIRTWKQKAGFLFRNRMSLTVYWPTQHGFMDQLGYLPAGLPEEAIRIVLSPMAALWG